MTLEQMAEGNSLITTPQVGLCKHMATHLQTSVSQGSKHCNNNLIETMGDKYIPTEQMLHSSTV